MCKLASFFIHQPLHLLILLLLNVSLAHCVASSPSNKHITDASTQNASSLTSTAFSEANAHSPNPATRSTVNDRSVRLMSETVPSVNSSDEVEPTLYRSHQQAIASDMQTNLDHLNELNKINNTTSNLIYTDQYVVQLIGGPELAKELTQKHGFIYLGQIFDNHYHLKHRRLAKRSLEPAHHDFHRLLVNEPNVNYVKQQTLKKRVKRDFMPIAKPQSANGHLSKSNTNPNTRFNDPQWPQMWYLSNRVLDMNVQKVWDHHNITGKNIVVTILDDGLEKDHPDIAQNYDEKASYDVNNLDPDPQPRYDMLDSNRHGTRCAANQHIHIYSASWGTPDDDGRTVDGPGELATRAFVEGVTKGRGGLGSIFIWASGNGGREHDNCNCDGYTNSIWTLSISSATENGLVPWYSEACSSTLATTYSSGAYGEKQIITTDLHHRCTNTHTGTSASAPLAAGIAALTLQANPRLTWRDMQHLVVQTANPGNLQANDWKTNGVGRKVSHSFGYGLMDAEAMVSLAKEWVTVPSQKICETRSNPINRSIPFKSYVELSLEVHCDKVKYLEHVQAKINLTTNRRGDIHIYLVSPAGTRSTLVAERPMDNSRAGYVNWAFMSVFYWGEQPAGKWKLEIHNEGKYHNRANLKEWTLIMYGTSENPDRRRKANTGSNGRNTFSSGIVATLNKASEGRQSGGATHSADNVYSAFPTTKLSSLNKTKLNTVIKLTSAKGMFDAAVDKNSSKLQSNGHQFNTVSNDLTSILNQPDINLDPMHTGHNLPQPPDQEPNGNDIDKSTRAEKSGNEPTFIPSKSKEHRLGNRLNANVNSVQNQQSVESMKSDGREGGGGGSGSSGEYEHQTENGAASQNRIASEGCPPNNVYFRGFCLARCPDAYYGTELVASVDSLNAPVINLTFLNNRKLLVSRKRRLNAAAASSPHQQSSELKVFKDFNDLKEQINASTYHQAADTVNADHTTSLNSSSSTMTNEETDLNDSSTSTTTTATSSQQPTTLPTSVPNELPFIDLPYISHNSIKQKDLNKLILLKQQELAETYRNHENNLYYQLMRESEQQFEDTAAVAAAQNNDPKVYQAGKQAADDRLEHISICLKCHYTCKRCVGKKSTQCTACYQDSQLDELSGRCLLKDVAQTLTRYKSTSASWSTSEIAFDPRVQNWITICSLILCLFFSMAFFYLLLCRRDHVCDHKPPFFAAQYHCPQARHLPTKPSTHLKSYNLDRRDPCSSSSSANEETNNLNDTSQSTEPNRHHPHHHHPNKKSSSFFVSILRFLNLKKSSSVACNGVAAVTKANSFHHLSKVKYDNIPVRYEVVKCSNGDVVELNESLIKEIT